MFEFLKHKKKIQNSKIQIIKMQLELKITIEVENILTIFNFRGLFFGAF